MRCGWALEAAIQAADEEDTMTIEVVKDTAAGLAANSFCEVVKEAAVPEVRGFGFVITVGWLLFSFDARADAATLGRATETDKEDVVVVDVAAVAGAGYVPDVGAARDTMVAAATERGGPTGATEGELAVLVLVILVVGVGVVLVVATGTPPDMETADCGSESLASF